MVRDKERIPVAHTRVDVIHHDKDAGTLQVQVGIDVDYRVSAQFHPVFFRL